ncbi:LysR family transcriptional regulator [Paraburkholderia sp. CNPSo 3157]|uniref:LysR family transcriptional regulator n=1 Tax=Paraburkholderia franconis TaxID=2654983 RepID=A0A7X1NAR7_9BURK|nr:LysR family transcriptional regulator [Paraburkholderia franconis]MPW18141.1 LysR family transcriptional regulator [Paraburkholderia franconis]
MNQVNLMRVFVRTAESGSFRRAADQSQVSGAQVSRAIASLESRVQTQLLSRTTRKVSLTEAGMRYLQGSREFLEKLDQLDRSVSRNDGICGGTLRVVATDALPPQTLIRLLDAYRHRCPEVKVHISPGEGLSHLLDDRHDVALFDGSWRPILGGELETVPLSFPAQRLIPCAAPAYLAESTEPAEPEELASHACISNIDRLQQLVWKFVDANGNIHDVSINPCYTVNSAYHLRLAAIAGMGVAVLPEPLVADEIANSRLKRILPCHTIGNFDTTVSLVYPRRRFLNQRVRAFIDNAIELAGQGSATIDLMSEVRSE